MRKKIILALAAGVCVVFVQLSVLSQTDTGASRGIIRHVENGNYGDTLLYDSNYAFVFRLR